MENKEKDEEDEVEAVADFVRKEVSDWDDEFKGRARFKALSGLRSDWKPLYLWRNLIIKVARHLRIFLIHPSHVQCLCSVKMACSLCASTAYLWRCAKPVTYCQSPPPIHLLYILAALLEERAMEVVKTLSENHWTNSCVITMTKFQEIRLGSKEEALVILNYLSTHGKEKHIVMNTAERIVVM